jgi:hypothetical protein
MSLLNEINILNLFIKYNKILYLQRFLKKTDSVAQQVEHIPFKDGVLGSRPSRITNNLL